MNEASGTRGKDDEPSFADALDEDVHPLEKGPQRSQARGVRTARRRGPTDPTRFITPDPEEPRLAHAPGVQRRVLRKLGAGGYPAERTIDLHQMRAVEARAWLRREIGEALTAGEQCLLIVHGRGAHSAEAPVLKRALPGWLAEPEIGEHIVAFAPARKQGGGAGALYLLLSTPS